MSDLAQQRKEMAEAMMRDAICTAAIDVLSAVGYGSLTMDRVAEAAGVSKGTLYNYYKDKDALMLAVVDITFTPLMKGLTAVFRASLSARDYLLKAGWTVLSGMDERRAIGEVLCRGELTPVVEGAIRELVHIFQEELTQVVSAAIAKGEMAVDGATSEAGGRMLFLALHGMMDERLKHPGDSPTLKEDFKTFETFIVNTWFRS